MTALHPVSFVVLQYSKYPDLKYDFDCCVDAFVTIDPVTNTHSVLWGKSKMIAFEEHVSFDHIEKTSFPSEYWYVTSSNMRNKIEGNGLISFMIPPGFASNINFTYETNKITESVHFEAVRRALVDLRFPQSVRVKLESESCLRCHGSGEVRCMVPHSHRIRTETGSGSLVSNKSYSLAQSGWVSSGSRGFSVTTSNACRRCNDSGFVSCTACAGYGIQSNEEYSIKVQYQPLTDGPYAVSPIITSTDI